MRSTVIAIIPDPPPLFSGIPWGAWSCRPSREHWASWSKWRPRPRGPHRREGFPGKFLPRPFIPKNQPSTYQDCISVLTLSTPPNRVNVAPLAPLVKMGSPGPWVFLDPWSCGAFWRGRGQGERELRQREGLGEDRGKGRLGRPSSRLFALQGEVGAPGHKGSKGDKGDAVSGDPREGAGLWRGVKGILRGWAGGWVTGFPAFLSPILTLK